MSSDETLRRLRSAHGHLDAVIRMVQGALDRSRRALLDNHLRTCVADAYAAGAYDPAITELLDAMLGSGSPRPRTQDAVGCAVATATAGAPAAAP